MTRNDKIKELCLAIQNEETMNSENIRQVCQALIAWEQGEDEVDQEALDIAHLLLIELEDDDEEDSIT